MTRFFANANYDFIGFRKYAYGVTAAVLIPGLLWLAFVGLNYSIEFTGGTLIRIRSEQALDAGRLRSALDAQGIHGAEIQSFGSEREYTIRARVAKAGTDADDTEATASAVTSALDAALGAGSYSVQKTEAVGPKVGGELRTKAFLAVFLSFFAVLAYLAWRFEWRFGLAAVVATAHDILATIAFVGVMRLEVSLVVVGALLSMVGYSLNDTIIIFDRVRENLHKYKRDDFASILNRSINETLPRSVLTHATTLVSLLALAVLAGEVIRPFALVMFFGVFTGTFSSIYIAAPVLMWIEHKWPGAGPRREGHRAARGDEGSAGRLSPCWSTRTATSAIRPSRPIAPRWSRGRGPAGRAPHRDRRVPGRDGWGSSLPAGGPASPPPPASSHDARLDRRHGSLAERRAQRPAHRGLRRDRSRLPLRSLPPSHSAHRV
jgi:preprotein translocase subunit SecF